MRMIFAFALVAIVAISGRAQAPSAAIVPAPEISFVKHFGHTETVQIKFADGSQLQADKLDSARSSEGNVVRFKEERQPFAQWRTERVQVDVTLPNGEVKKMPFPLELTLSGNVRLTIVGQ